MKSVFCFVLLFYICFFIENSDESDNYFENIHAGIYRGNVEKYDEHQLHGNYNNPIIRPCDLKDLKCIRRIFAHNSKCKPVEGPVPDPYLLKRLDLPIPQANLTYSIRNVQVKGLNAWKIKTFFMNKATDRLVLEVVFDTIVQASPESTAIYHRKGKEPIEETDYSIIEFSDVSLTLTIPNIKDLQLSKGHVFTYIPDAAPIYILGPAVYNNKDPDFNKGISVWLNNLGVTMQEIWETQGPAYMDIFLQSTICDFSYH